MNWLPLFRRPPTPRARQTRARRHRVRPTLELLESRFAPATYLVNTTADLSIAAGVDPNTGTINGSGGQVSLRSAIQAANSNPGGNTILLNVPGTYSLMPPATAGESDNAAGELVILPSGGDLSIQNNSSGGGVAVDAGNNSRVLDINPNFDPSHPTAPFKVTLNGFTIQNGHAFQDNSSNLAVGSGGGIRDQGNASLTLVTMVVQNNSADTAGGGIAMENTVSTPWTLEIDHCTISGNSARNGGGGVETAGHGMVLISNTQVLNNTSGPSGGGGVLLDTIFTVQANGTTFLPESATATLNGDTISGNNGGGGVENAGDASNADGSVTGITIANCTFAGNSTNGNGGGFGDQGSQHTVTITASTFTKNTAGNGPPLPGSQGQGGGISVTSSNLIITGSTIQNNAATVRGGGIAVGTASPLVTSTLPFLLQNSTVTGNIITFANQFPFPGTGLFVGNDGPDVFGNVSDIGASTGNTIGIVDQFTNLANGYRAVQIDLNTPIGVAGLVIDPNGTVREFFPGLGAQVNMTQALHLAPSLYASVAFIPSGQILVLTQQDGSVLQLALINGQWSIGSLTPLFGPCRAVSVAVHNGVEVLVVTFANGQVAQFGSDGSIINLTQLLDQLAFPPSALPPSVMSVSPPALSVSVGFNPFTGQEWVVMTDTNGVVTVFPPAEAITLFGVETLFGIPSGAFINRPTPIPRSGVLGPTLSQTASLAFPGSDPNGLALVNIDQTGNFLFTVFQNGLILGPANLGPAPLG